MHIYAVIPSPSNSRWIFFRKPFHIEFAFWLEKEALSAHLTIWSKLECGKIWCYIHRTFSWR